MLNTKTLPAAPTLDVDLFAAFEKATGTPFVPGADTRTYAQIERDEYLIDQYLTKRDDY